MKILMIDGLQELKEHLLISRNVKIKFVTCGRNNCRCRLGHRHGPYYYIRKKVNGKYRDIYVKLPEKISDFSYEEVGSSLLLEVQSRDQIPEFLESFPSFIVHDRLS